MQATLRQQSSVADRARFGWSWLYHHIGVAGFGLLMFFAGMAVNNHEATREAVDPLKAQVVQKSAQIQRLQSSDIPKLKSALGCEHRKADVALDAATGAGADLSGLPDCPPISSVSKLGK
jgi:hypothetical protein